jgi:hypothetical protein
MAMEEQLSIRFSALEITEITRIAKEEDRSLGFVVRELVGEAITARHEKEQS